MERRKIGRRTRKRSSGIQRSRVCLCDGDINKKWTMTVRSIENSQIRALVLCLFDCESQSRKRGDTVTITPVSFPVLEDSLFL